MGRIKSILVKRTARTLQEEVGGFSKDFEHNKIRLDKTMPSKSIRNKVAGYLTRLAQQQSKEQKITQNGQPTS